MVQPHGAGAFGRPDRREERHAVPDLDEPVARAVPTHHLAERGAREHEVAAGLANDAVAVAPADLRRSGRVGGAHRHLDARLPPQFGDPRRVQLGAPGLGIVDVAPGQDRDAAQARGRGDIAELGHVGGPAGRTGVIRGGTHAGGIAHKNLASAARAKTTRTARQSRGEGGPETGHTAALPRYQSGARPAPARVRTAWNRRAAVRSTRLKPR